MKCQINRSVWATMISGVIFAAVGFSANAADVHSRIILDEAYHDYSGVPTVESQGATRRHLTFTRKNRTILDEAIDDYQDEEITVYAHAESLEQAEFAAMKTGKISIPWVLTPQD